MKAKEKAEILGDFDSLLVSLDTLTSGKSNVIFKTDLYVLRNKVVDLQEKYA